MRCLLFCVGANCFTVGWELFLSFWQNESPMKADFILIESIYHRIIRKLMFDNYKVSSVAECKRESVVS